MLALPDSACCGGNKINHNPTTKYTKCKTYMHKHPWSGVFSFNLKNSINTLLFDLLLRLRERSILLIICEALKIFKMVHLEFADGGEQPCPVSP